MLYPSKNLEKPRVFMLGSIGLLAVNISGTKDALHMYAENEQAMKRNEAVLNEFHGELYAIEANDKISDNCKYPLVLIQAAQNKSRQTQGVQQSWLS